MDGFVPPESGPIGPPIGKPIGPSIRYTRTRPKARQLLSSTRGGTTPGDVELQAMPTVSVVVDMANEEGRRTSNAEEEGRRRSSCYPLPPSEHAQDRSLLQDTDA